MVRASFAPMLKFSNLVGDFTLLAEELQMEEQLLTEVTDQKEKDMKILQQLKQN